MSYGTHDAMRPDPYGEPYALEARIPETGSIDPVGAIVGGVAQVADIIEGGDKKRERTAEAERDAAQANRDAAALELQAQQTQLALAQVNAGSLPPSAPGAATAPRFTIQRAIAWLAQPGWLGLPHGVFVAVPLIAGGMYLRHSRENS